MEINTKSKTKSLRSVVKKHFPNNSDDNNNFTSIYRATQRYIWNIFGTFGIDTETFKETYVDQQRYKINEKAEDIILKQLNKELPTKKEIKEHIDNRDEIGKDILTLLNEFIQENFYGETQEQVLNEFKKIKEYKESIIEKNFSQLGIRFIIKDNVLRNINNLICEYEFLCKTMPSETEYGYLSIKTAVVIHIHLALQLLDNDNNILKKIREYIELTEKIREYIDC